MFHKVPDKESNNTSRSSSRKARRRRKKKVSANLKVAKKDIKTKSHKLFTSMSTWAENYAVAATWQLKHQIAFWKAKALSYKYENLLLHDLIREYKLNAIAKAIKSDHAALSATDDSDEDAENMEHGQNGNSTEDRDFEVSEEFIQFLAANAKYKEDAKRERERLRAKVEEETTIQEPNESTEDRQIKLKDLYGNNWQKITALEIALQSQFIHDVDNDKPMYWPNIPLNL